MTYSRRGPLFTRRKALWRSGWLPVFALAFLVGHATFGVRAADHIAKFAAKIAQRKFQLSPTDEQTICDLRGQLWCERQLNFDLQMRLRAEVVKTACDLPNAPRFERVPARIVLRDAADWASFIWVEMPGPAAGFLQAPAVLGDVAVGIVDFTSQNRCRIRLLSDSQFSLSVTNVAREKELNADGLISKSCGQKAQLVGQVRGFGGALWNSSGTLLIGEGYVPSLPKGMISDLAQRHLGDQKRFAPGENLVTSGLDGIFPPNLQVGRVDRVEPDRSGATRYEFAVVGALNLHELREIAVLQKINSDVSDRGDAVKTDA